MLAAARQGDEKAVLSALARGADIEAKDKE